MQMKKRNLIILIVGAAVVVGALLANLGMNRKDRTDVTVEEVEQGTLTAKVSGPGRVRAETTVQVSSSVMGRIVDLAVEEGDVVRRGQFLMRLDDVYYRSAVAQARARLERARTELATAEREASDAGEQFAKGLVSEKTHHDARAMADAARQAREEAAAALKAAEDQLEKTVFHSPIDGVITQLNVEEGENVVTGTMNAPGTVIMTISDLAGMEVEAEIDETDIVDVRVGQKAEIEVDALADTTLTGRVTEVGNSGVTRMGGTQEEATSFIVKVLVDSPHAVLKPGMTATVEIETAVHDSVLNVPIQAVASRTPSSLEPAKKGGGKEEDDGPAATKRSGREEEKEIEGVFAVVGDTVKFVPVVTGIADDLSIEVAGELAVGQKVVSGPYKVLRTLRGGDAVKVEETAKKDEEGSEKKE
jgi:HlyD family secretion protein